jgi:hypothetical protein
MKLLIDAHVFLTSWRQGAAYEDISGPQGSRPMPSFLATRAAQRGERVGRRGGDEAQTLEYAP